MAIKNSGASSGNRKLRLTGAIILLVVAIGVVYWGYARQHPSYQTAPSQVWFYDVDAKKLFPVPINNTAVTEKGPSGGVAYRAFVFRCGQCENASVADIVYIEDNLGLSAPAADDAAGGATKVPKFVLRQQALQNPKVTTPDKLDAWVDSLDPEGIKLTSAASTKCDGKPAQECFPQ